MGYDSSIGLRERSASFCGRAGDVRRNKTRGLRGLLGAGTALAVLSPLFATCATAATATDTATVTADAPSQSAQVEMIVVTAQKREQNLQRVPISATVTTGQTIQTENLTSVIALSELDPSIHINPSTNGSSNIFVRGIGSGSANVFSQSVSTFIDDVYFPQSHMSLAAFVDENNVQILKGPQTTYFGSNAIAGAINIQTNKPGDTTDVSARALYGSYGSYALEAEAGGPINDVFGMRVAFIEAGDSGWLYNESTGQHEGDNEFTGRLTFTFKPVDNYNATLKIEEDHLDNSGADLQITACPPAVPFTATGYCKTALTSGYPVGVNTNNVAQLAGQGASFDQNLFELTQHYNNWGQTFTSVTAFYSNHYQLKIEQSVLPDYLTAAMLPLDYSQFSQEFRVASPEDQKLSYLAGAYFQVDHNQIQAAVDGPGFNVLAQNPASLPAPLNNPAFAPIFKSLLPFIPLAIEEDGTTYDLTYSFFGALTWHATDSLTFTGGLRYTNDYKSFIGNNYVGTAVAPFTHPQGRVTGTLPLIAAGLIAPIGSVYGNGGSNALLPSGSVQYQIVPSAMAYFRYDRGYLAGGFGDIVSGKALLNPYKPESADAFEVGIKTQWFDNSLRLNLDLFQTNYTNLQVVETVINTSGTGTSNEIVNAATSITRGVEGEFEWVANDHFQFSGNFAYDDAYYGNFPGNGLTQLQTFCQTAAANTPACVAAFGGTGVWTSATQNLAGKPTAFAPAWTGNITGTYTTPLAGGFNLTAQLEGIFSSGYYTNGTNDDPLDYIPAWTRLDGKLTLLFPDHRWALDLIGKNLTNAVILTDVTNLAAPLTAPKLGGSTESVKEEPLNVSVQIRFKW